MEELRKEFDVVKRYTELRKAMNMTEALLQLKTEIEQKLSKKQNWSNDELGKEISNLRDIIWDKVGEEHQSGMVASPEYVVLLAKDLLSKQVTEEEFRKWHEELVNKNIWKYHVDYFIHEIFSHYILIPKETK